MGNRDSQRIAKNTIYLYLRMILMMCVSLYTSRIILRVLGFEDFGLYNVVGSVVTFLSFFQAALRNATSRFITFELGRKQYDKLSSIFSMAINSHILLGAFLVIVMEICGSWVLNNKLEIASERLYAANCAYQFSLATFFLTIVRSPFDSCIIAYEYMSFYALTSIVEVVMRLLSVLCLIAIPYDNLIIFSFLQFFIAFLLLIWYIVFCYIKFKDCRYIYCWEKKIIILFSKYSGWSILVNGATITRTQCINIFFNIFLGILSNAAMGIANQVVAALNQFVNNFTQAYKPQIIKSWAAKDYDYFIKLVYSTSKISYYLLFIISVPVIINIDYFLTLWLVEYPPMAPVFVETIIIYYLIDAIQEPLVISVHATGNLRFHQIMISSIVILVIPIAYIMLKMGYSGKSVLFVNAMANLICAIGRTIYMKTLIKLDLWTYFTRVIVPVIMVTVFSLPIPLYIVYLLKPTFLNVIFATCISIGIIACLCLFIGFDKSEKNLINSVPIVKKIKNKFNAK